MNKFLCAILAIACICPAMSAQDKEKTEAKQKSNEEKALDALVARSRGLHMYFFNKYVQRELDITDEQLKKLKKAELKYNRLYLNVERPKGMQAGWVKQPDGTTKHVGVEDTPQYKAYIAKTREIRSKQSKAAMNVLLPHQKKRMLQILAQKQLHAGSAPFGAYTNKKLPALIGGLTSAEKSMLKKSVSENYKKYIADIVALKKKYELEVRKGLPKEQQKKLDELFGEPFLWLNQIR